MSLVIIPFEERFASSAAEIEKACFSEPWSEQSLLSELQREDSVMFAALLDEKVIGWAGLEHVCGEGRVTNIAVLPQNRRIGAGEALTRSLIDACEQLSLISLTLEVRPSNAAAISLYKKLGFKELGIRPNFYSFPREDALMMQLEFPR